MSTSPLARRYARALYDLANEQKMIDRVQRDLGHVAQAWDTSAELRAVFENPAFGATAKKNVLKAIAQKAAVSPIVANTLSLLADRNRVRYLKDIADAYTALVESKSGRVRAEVTTASPLSDAYYTQLEKLLADATGKAVTIVRKVDPNIIGGVVTRVGDTVYDGSIKNRLSDLRAQLLQQASPTGAR